MNVKLFVMVVALATILLATPLVDAIPGAEKKNEKFLSLEINKIGGPPVGPPMITFHPEPPKEPQLRRVILHEGMVSLEIKIDDSVSYNLGVDFTYESTLTIDFHLNSDPVVANLRAEQTYVFLPASGITGTLKVLTIGKMWPNGLDGESSTYSYGYSVGYGTGDLDTILLKATGWHIAEVIHHEGYVTNWPVP